MFKYQQFGRESKIRIGKLCSATLKNYMKTVLDVLPLQGEGHEILIKAQGEGTEIILALIIFNAPNLHPFSLWRIHTVLS